VQSSTSGWSLCSPSTQATTARMTGRRAAVSVGKAAADTIAAEIQRSLDFYMATSGESEISTVFLSGGTSNLPFLAQAIQRRTRVAVEIWSPVERLQVDTKSVDMGLLTQRAPQLAVALGLALRRDREEHQ
jgi:type IV pilus assembly protein PilM